MSRTARQALLAWLLITLACVAAPLQPRTTFDGARCPVATCARAVDYRLDPAFSTSEVEIVRTAMAVWVEGTGGRVCFRETGVGLFFVRLARREELRPFDDHWSKHTGLYRLSVVWLVWQHSISMLEIVVHEIGHALDLPHHEDPRSIMHPKDGALVAGKLHALDREAYCASTKGCACRP